MKRTDPTVSLLKGGAYVRSWHTDIRETFAKARGDAQDFASVYLMLAKHYPTRYALQRAVEIAFLGPHK